jgi:phosphohistidine phosphatase SixA
MKKICSSIILMLLFFIGYAQSIPAGVSSKTRIYLVRHAEKGTTPPNNPPLTGNGNNRAGDLMRRLQNKNVKRIYVTQFLRTQMTGDSLRIQLGIDTVKYQAEENGNDLFAKITLHNDFNKTSLIIGHSNTVPDYILKLGVANYSTANIPDNEFDNLYLVYYKRTFPFFGRLKAHVKNIKYGAVSAASAAMQ